MQLWALFKSLSKKYFFRGLLFEKCQAINFIAASTEVKMVLLSQKSPYCSLRQNNLVTEITIRPTVKLLNLVTTIHKKCTKTKQKLN